MNIMAWGIPLQGHMNWSPLDSSPSRLYLILCLMGSSAAYICGICSFLGPVSFRIRIRRNEASSNIKIQVRCARNRYKCPTSSWKLVLFELTFLMACLILYASTVRRVADVKRIDIAICLSISGLFSSWAKERTLACWNSYIQFLWQTVCASSCGTWHSLHISTLRQ